MPTTFKPCEKCVHDMAKDVIDEYETHEALRNSGIKLDILFAYPPTDEQGQVIGDALKKNGKKVLAQTRICNLKERAKGHGDAEIVIDADHWESINDSEQRAILDHELTHIRVKTNKSGAVKTDDLSRPLLALRKHDVEVGWFTEVAKRHGKSSEECKQAAEIMETRGQFYWPMMLQQAIEAQKERVE